MSIASAITAAQGRVADCYTAISNKGGTLPATQNLANMPTAINSIPSGGGGVIDSLSITPTTSAQTITASGGVDGYSPISVSAVTSSIDANIQAENIKSGVSILGVTGTYSGGGGSSKYGCTIDNLLGNVDSNGKLQLPSNTNGDIVFTGVEDVADYALYYGFGYNRNLTHGVSFPDLTTISGVYGCYNTFFGCTGLTSVSLPMLTTISGSNGCYFMFYGCSGLTSVSLPELTTISSISGSASMFGTCYNLTNISIPKLSTATGTMALYGFVQYCLGLASISFPLLSNINGANIFMSAFVGCQSLSDIYFNSLTTTSFGSNISQFGAMFSSSTASTSGTCTVHFPSNLSSTISGLTGYPTFGGDSARIVLSFDLPATS